MRRFIGLAASPSMARRDQTLSTFRTWCFDINQARPTDHQMNASARWFDRGVAACIIRPRAQVSLPLRRSARQLIGRRGRCLSWPETAAFAVSGRTLRRHGSDRSLCLRYRSLARFGFPLGFGVAHVLRRALLRSGEAAPPGPTACGGDLAPDRAPGAAAPRRGSRCARWRHAGVRERRLTLWRFWWSSAG